MDSEVLPPDEDREVTLALEASDLRDEVEALARRMRATLGGGLAISALFVVAGTLMEQSSTLWFLAMLWLFFTVRLLLINRTCGAEKGIKEAALKRLASSPLDDRSPADPSVTMRPDSVLQPDNKPVYEFPDRTRDDGVDDPRPQ